MPECEPISARALRTRGLVCLASAVVWVCGCGRNLGDRVVIETEGVSIRSPSEWVVDEENHDGATVIRGNGGRLSVVVLDTSPPAREPASLMDTLQAMSPELKIVKQRDFSSGVCKGKEFIVSYEEEGRRQTGAVYLLSEDGKLCVLTFTARRGGLEKQLDAFRGSAGTLRFLESR